MKKVTPTFQEEKKYWARGYRFVAGIDEVGRGPLAGPVVAAAVILPNDIQYAWCDLVADSKIISQGRREYLFGHICRAVISYGIGIIDARTIDIVGITKATRLAMQLAVKELQPTPDYLLIDYLQLPEVRIHQSGVIEGDSVCFSIACASIIAKVTRDHLMNELDSEYPGYYFTQHKGYGTKKHLECLKRLGPSPIHRVSFQPVRDCLAASTS